GRAPELGSRWTFLRAMFEALIDVAVRTRRQNESGKLVGAMTRQFTVEIGFAVDTRIAMNIEGRAMRNGLCDLGQVIYFKTSQRVAAHIEEKLHSEDACVACGAIPLWFLQGRTAGSLQPRDR